MIREILCITWLSLLMGCTDRPMAMKGTEAVIYPELQRFDITMKNNDTAAVEQQVVSIIHQLLPASTDTEWSISYRLKRNVEIADIAVKKLKASGVKPSQITVLEVSNLASDIAIEVRQYHLLTGACKPYSLEQYKVITGCFVDNLRMKQVVSPSSLIHVVKE